MAITRTTAQERAIEIIKSALGSNSIKLVGPMEGSYNQKNLAADAEYLNGLITSLTDKLYENARRERDE